MSRSICFEMLAFCHKQTITCVYHKDIKIPRRHYISQTYTWEYDHVHTHACTCTQLHSLLLWSTVTNPNHYGEFQIWFEPSCCAAVRHLFHHLVQAHPYKLSSQTLTVCLLGSFTLLWKLRTWRRCWQMLQYAEWA